MCCFFLQLLFETHFATTNIYGVTLEMQAGSYVDLRVLVVL